MQPAHPILYSYRRCPYAMRARLAIFYSGIQVEQREIVFWDKPEPMLQASPKGTVPVLVLPDGHVIDESRDIMQWAIKQSVNTTDQAWLFENVQLNQQISDWIDECDHEFKAHLDHYKYADRFPEKSQQDYRQLGCQFLDKIETALQAYDSQMTEIQTMGLVNARLSLADIAIFPFIRQFVNVDKIWFEQACYPNLKLWLAQNLECPAFKAVMKNRPVWEPEHHPLWVDEPNLSTKDSFRNKAFGATN